MTLLVALACATPPETPDSPRPAMLTPADAPSPAVNTHPADETCLIACMRKNMARAVAAEIIEADCKRACKDASQRIDETPSL